MISILDLPNELLFMIVERLDDIRDISNLCLVSKRFNDISKKVIINNINDCIDMWISIRNKYDDSFRSKWIKRLKTPIKQTTLWKTCMKTFDEPIQISQTFNEMKIILCCFNYQKYLKRISS